MMEPPSVVRFLGQPVLGGHGGAPSPPCRNPEASSLSCGLG